MTKVIAREIMASAYVVSTVVQVNL